VAADGEEFDAYRQLELRRLAASREADKLEKDRQEISGRLAALTKQFEQVQNYQNYQQLKKQLRPVAFDSDLYQKAVDLNAQIKALKAAVKETGEAVDPEALAKRKEQVRSWRQELSQLQQSMDLLNQQINQLKEKQANLLELTPHLDQVQKLTMDQFQQLEADWEDCQKAAPAPQPALPPYAGLIVAACGLALLAVNRILAVLVIIAGLALAAYSYFKKPAPGPDKAAAFKEKYGLDPASRLDSLISPYRDLALSRKDQQAAQEQLAVKQEQLKELAGRLGLQEANPETLARRISQEEEQTERAAAALRAYQETSAANLNYQKQISALTDQLLDIYRQAGVQNLAAYQDLAKQRQEQLALKAQITALSNSLGDQLAVFEAGFDLDRFKQQGRQAQEQLAGKQAELSARRQEIANVLAEEKRYARSSQVAQDKQELAEIADNFRRDSQDYLASLLAGEVIGRTLDLASNDRFPKMLKLAQEYLSLLTGGRYGEIILPAKISKKTPLKVVRADKKKIPLAYLSRGTQEQLYFALKLAFVMQIKDKIDLPILIDDSFVNFDGPRTGYIVNLLQKLSQDKQILVFTARADLAEAVSLEPIRYTRED
ncbi:ATP-binding protein, partial [Lactobacillus nasalidis]